MITVAGDGRLSVQEGTEVLLRYIYVSLRMVNCEFLVSCDHEEGFIQFF